MNKTIQIDDLLEQEGFGYPEAAVRTREALEQAGLTRAGKVRMAEEKRDQAREVLSHFVPLCDRPQCQALAGERFPGREVLPTSRERCAACRGSDNRAAVFALVACLRRHSLDRILVLGGTAVLHRQFADLLAELPKSPQFRYVDGTSGVFSSKDAGHDLKWAEVMVIWSSTPLPHKVSWTYTENPACRSLKKITVTQRGISSLCEQVMKALGNTK